MEPETIQSVYESMCQHPANAKCFECDEPRALNVSVTHAIFICEACAKQHRALGPQISFVQAITVEWTARQLAMLKAGGNEQLQEFFEAYELTRGTRIQYKYKTVAAHYYREWLRAQATGQSCPLVRPEPAAGIELFNLSLHKIA